MTIGMMRMAGTPYLNFLMVEVYAAKIHFFLGCHGISYIFVYLRANFCV